MIGLITGVPGSGKSLYAVKKLLEAKARGEYTITNIEGYKYADEFIDALTQDEMVSFILGRDWSDFAKSLGNRKIYLVIDEAQRVYASTGMNRATQQEMFYFLEYHRHYGANIDLVTQSHKSLNGRVYGLVHQIVQISKIKGLTGEQRLRILDPTTWELIATEKFKRKQEYYDAYQSASVEAGHQTPPTAMKRIKIMIGLMVGALLLLFTFMVFTVLGFIDDDEQPTEEINQEKTTKQGSTTPTTANTPQTTKQDSTEQNTNKTPLPPPTKQAVYARLGLTLDKFFIQSNFHIPDYYDGLKLGYAGGSAVFTRSELATLGIEYRRVSQGSGILVDVITNQQVFIQAPPEVEERPERSEDPIKALDLPQFSTNPFASYEPK